MRAAAFLALGGVFLAGGALAQPTGDRAAGRQLAGQCRTCQGADVIATIPEAPNLAGETNIYIDTQLKAFRLGKREDARMSPIAAELTDGEIRAAAEGYASVKLTIEPVD